jgi:hypothetical protein
MRNMSWCTNYSNTSMLIRPQASRGPILMLIVSLWIMTQDYNIIAFKQITIGYKLHNLHILLFNAEFITRQRTREQKQCRWCIVFAFCKHSQPSKSIAWNSLSRGHVLAYSSHFRTERCNKEKDVEIMTITESFWDSKSASKLLSVFFLLL